MRKDASYSLKSFLSRAYTVSSNSDRLSVHGRKKQHGHPHSFFFFLFLLTVERVKAESAQTAAKMLEEMQIKNQQMMEQKEKSYQEHVKQLTEKMERDRAQLLQEQERTLSLKLQVFNCITLRFLLFCFLSTLPVHKLGMAVRT